MTVQAPPPGYEVAPVQRELADPNTAYTSYTATQPERIESGPANKQQDDEEAGKASKRRGFALWGKQKESTGRVGGALVCILFGGLILLAVAALGAIVFGISVGVEKGLTG